MGRVVILTALLSTLCIGAARAQCAPSHTFVTGEVLTAATLNSNPVSLANCINSSIANITVFASSIVPTNTTQATFGGTQVYTFPNGVTTGGTIQIANSTTTGVLRLGGASASGTLDFGLVAGSFRFNGGPLVTTTAQACGTISGYHIECKIVFVAGNSCTGASICGTTATATFSTSYASQPICSVSGTSGAQLGIYPYLGVPGTSSVIISWYNTQSTQSTATQAEVICVGV